MRLAVPDVSGTVAKGYEPVRAAFAQGMAGDPGGAQLCIYRHGERVVDLWCGQDPLSQRAYDGETLGITMSVSKGVTATCAHILAQRGLLDLDAPVATYWPEFAVNGKAGIRVSDLLSHRAGLAALPADVTVGPAEMLDWDTMVQILGGMAPLWEPGTQFAYHGLSFGWLVGEVVRRITGKRLGQVVSDEIARPLDADIWLSLPEAEEPRVAPQFYPQPTPLEAGQLAVLNSRAGHVGEIPAGNVIASARGIAKMYAALIGEVDGVRILDASSVDRARTPQTDAVPYFAPLGPPGGFGAPLRFGLGYELYRTAIPFVGEGSFGHSGSGGKLGFASPERGLAVGFHANCMSWKYDEGPDTRWAPWFRALELLTAD